MRAKQNMFSVSEQKKRGYSFYRLLNSSSMYWTGIFLLKTILDFSYVFFVHPNYSYAGFGLEFNLTKYIEASVLLVLFALFTPKKLFKPSDYLLFTVLYAFLIPLFSFYAFSNEPRLFLYLALVCTALVYMFRIGKPFRLPQIKNGQTYSLYICFLFSLLVTGWFVYSSGFKYFNLNLKLVYDFRGDVSETSYVGVMVYLIPWTTKVIGPGLMGYAMYKKNRNLMIVSFFLHTLWFGFSSHKSVLFYPFLIVALWAWFTRTNALVSLLFGVSCILLLSLLLYFVFDDLFMASMFIRRVFFVIAKNTFLYFEYFSVNEHVYWSNSILSRFLEYPYDINPAKLIGWYQNTESHVNNSYVSTAYMHAGVFGIVLYGILVGLILRILDSLSNNYMQTLLVLSVVLTSSRSLLLSADLPTALLTHGLGFAILISLFMKGSNKESY